MSLYVDTQGGVRVTGYLESFNLMEIVSALGFKNRKLFKYRCQNLNQQANQGFKAWANGLANCGSSGGEVNLEELDSFVSGNEYYDKRSQYETSKLIGSSRPKKL